MIPGERRDRRGARAPGQNLRAIIDPSQHHESILKAGRDDVLFRMTRDGGNALLIGRHHARLLAIGPSFEENGQRMSCSDPEVASHLPPAVKAIEVTLPE